MLLSVLVPNPTDIVAAIPPTTPFVGPETLEREMGRAFELRLGANESLFGPSPKAVEAMQAAAARGQFYGDPEGFELRSAIASRHGCSLENVVLASGIDELLMLFCRAYLPAGEGALTTFGSYPTFEYCVQSVGGHLLYANYLSDGRVDLESMAGKAAVLAYVANPDNPTGTWRPPSEVSEWRRAMPDGTLLLLDEAYADFAPEVAPFDAFDPGLVRLRTFSKGHGMAGLRVGYALCHRDHVETLNKIRLHFGVSSVALAGALASLLDTSHLETVVAETARVRDWVRSRFSEMGFESLTSLTNFLTVRMGPALDAGEVLLRLRGEQVFIRKPVKAFGDYIRVTVGPQPAMEEFLRRFAL